VACATDSPLELVVVSSVARRLFLLRHSEAAARDGGLELADLFTVEDPAADEKSDAFGRFDRKSRTAARHDIDDQLAVG
jgi:hypothetical protein